MRCASITPCHCCKPLWYWSAGRAACQYQSGLQSRCFFVAGWREAKQNPAAWIGGIGCDYACPTRQNKQAAFLAACLKLI
jgi:hypothetical protein